MNFLELGIFIVNLVLKIELWEIWSQPLLFSFYKTHTQYENCFVLAPGHGAHAWDSYSCKNPLHSCLLDMKWRGWVSVLNSRSLEISNGQITHTTCNLGSEHWVKETDNRNVYHKVNASCNTELEKLRQQRTRGSFPKSTILKSSDSD